MARMMITWTIIGSDWNRGVLFHAKDSSSVFFQLFHRFWATWCSPKVFYSNADLASPSFSWKAWQQLNHGPGVMPAPLSMPWNCVWTPREKCSCTAPTRKTHQQRLIINYKNRAAKDLRMSFITLPKEESTVSPSFKTNGGTICWETLPVMVSSIQPAFLHSGSFLWNLLPLRIQIETQWLLQCGESSTNELLAL